MLFDATFVLPTLPHLAFNFELVLNLFLNRILTYPPLETVFVLWITGVVIDDIHCRFIGAMQTVRHATTHFVLIVPDLETTQYLT